MPLALLLPALRFPRFRPLLAPLFSHSSSLSPLPFRPRSLPFPLSLLTSLTSHLPTTHFSALFPLPFRPPSSQPQLSSPTRPKIRPKLSLASRPPLGAGWRETVPPLTPSQIPPPDARASPVRPPPPARRAAQASPHRPATTSPTRSAPRPQSPCLSALTSLPSPLYPSSPTPPKCAPNCLKSFLEKTLIARETPISTPPTAQPICTLRAQTALTPPPFLTPPPQPDILNPPPIWAVICGGHTSS